jgi:hypothetical protein
MNNLTISALYLGLICSCLGLTAVAQSQARPSKTVPAGTVSGRVTVKGNGAPGVVVGLRVTDFTPRPGPMFKGTTDSDGSYRITNVPAGNYQVAPIAPAFVISDVTTFGARGRSLLLDEGESVGGVDFSLVKGGVITGKVTDADGRPVIEENISLFTAEQTNSAGRIYPVATLRFQTDDRGVYRVFGVPPGRYKVAVGQGENNRFGRISGRMIYKQTFHPDVTDLAKATVIELAEGGEASNIDISVGRVLPAFVASGRIVDGENGQPLVNVNFGVQMILGEARYSFSGALSASNSQGDFRIENLTAGKYSIFIVPQPNNEIRAETVTFEVVDQDVTGLMVKTSRGASLAGRVIPEGSDDKEVLSKLFQFEVQAYVQTESIGPNFQQSSRITGDGTFRIGGLGPGIAYLSLGSAQDRNWPKGFTISRIERDGQVQPDGIELKSGEQVGGLRILVVYGSATVRGTVRFENGTPPPDARINLRLTRPGELKPIMPNMMPPVVDSRGHFLIEDLAAGNYQLDVSAYIPGSRLRPPAASQQITVVDKVVNEITVTLDLKSGTVAEPKP